MGITLISLASTFPSHDTQDTGTTICFGMLQAQLAQLSSNSIQSSLAKDTGTFGSLRSLRISLPRQLGIASRCLSWYNHMP